ncbi:MAG: hypothetical protein ACLTT1_08380 [[Clostridium] scindens]
MNDVEAVQSSIEMVPSLPVYLYFYRVPSLFRYTDPEIASVGITAATGPRKRFLYAVGKQYRRMCNGQPIISKREEQGFIKVLFAADSDAGAWRAGSWCARGRPT